MLAHVEAVVRAEEDVSVLQLPLCPKLRDDGLEHLINPSITLRRLG